MALCSVTSDGVVRTLSMNGSPDGKGNYQNRFNELFATALLAALNEVEQDKNAGAVVLTSEGKFFSNGYFFSKLLQIAPNAVESDVLHQLLRS